MKAKKALAVLFAAGLVISLAACSGRTNTDTVADTEEATQEAATKSSDAAPETPPEMPEGQTPPEGMPGEQGFPGGQGVPEARASPAETEVRDSRAATLRTGLSRKVRLRPNRRKAECRADREGPEARAFPAETDSRDRAEGRTDREAPAACRAETAHPSITALRKNSLPRRRRAERPT